MKCVCNKIDILLVDVSECECIKNYWIRKEGLFNTYCKKGSCGCLCLGSSWFSEEEMFTWNKREFMLDAKHDIFYFFGFQETSDMRLGKNYDVLEPWGQANFNQYDQDKKCFLYKRNVSTIYFASKYVAQVH